MDNTAKVYVAGHLGLVGSAVKKTLEKAGYVNLAYKTRQELDLTNDQQTKEFFDKEKPEYVFLAAAKVGGIIANRDYPAEFIFQNLKIETNVINNSYLNGVKKLCFLGSTCIYPKLAPQPLKEEYLLTGSLEETNDAYAVAKIAGIKMCQSYNKQYGTNYISVMPTNLYGPNDNFDHTSSHVLPALIRRFHEAKVNNTPEVVIWGTGTPKREFLHVEDLAESLLFLMQNYNESEIINIGCGEDIAIIDLAHLISKVVGFKGEVKTDSTKPDGTPRKLVDVTKLFGLGWKPKVSLEEGIANTYKWFLAYKG